MNFNVLNPFFALFGGMFFLFAGYGLFLNSAGIKLTQSGVSQIVIGALNTAYFTGGALSAIASHRVISRVGHVRSFCVLGALFAVAALAHLMTDNLWAWGGLRLMLGFCYFSLLMVVESWLAERSDSAQRASVLAYYNVIYYAAFTIGILLMGAGFGSEQIFILSAILVMLAMLPIGLTTMAEPALPPQQRISLPRVFEIVPLALVCSFMGGLMVNGYFTMSSVFLLGVGYSVATISAILTAAMIGGFLGLIPIAKLSDRYGRRNAIVLCSALAVLAGLGTIISVRLVPDNMWLQYASAFVLGMGMIPLYSLGAARANDQLPDNMNTVDVSRSLLFSYGVGSLVAPLLIGFVMRWSGNTMFSVVFIAAAGILLIYALSQETVPIELRSVFVSMPGDGSGLMPELDPRNEESDVSVLEENLAQVALEQDVNATEIDQP